MAEIALMLLPLVPPALKAVSAVWPVAKQMFNAITGTAEIEVEQLLEDCVDVIEYMQGEDNPPAMEQYDAPPSNSAPTVQAGQPYHASGQQTSNLAAAV